MNWGDGDGITSNNGQDCAEVLLWEDFKDSRNQLDTDFPLAVLMTTKQVKTIPLAAVQMSYFKSNFTLELITANTTNFIDFDPGAGKIVMKP